MSEFKAQILGIVIVLAVFGMLLIGYKQITQSTIDNVSKEISEVIENG